MGEPAASEFHAQARAAIDSLAKAVSGQPAKTSGRTPIGVISAMNGATVDCALDTGDAAGNANLAVGGLAVMPGAASVLYGMVHALASGGGNARIAEIQLIGEAVRCAPGEPAVFRRGVTSYPNFGAQVMSADEADLRLVYSPPAVATIQLGSINQSANIGAYGLTDELLAKHFAVLGTTGTGKSCAVSLILHAVLDQNPNGHIVLIDPHNEYAMAFGERAEVVHVSNLQLPYWMLNFEELVEVVIGRNQDRAYPEIEILKHSVLEAKKALVNEAGRSDHITVDTPVPYRLGDMIKVIDDALGKLERTEETVSYLRLKSKIESLRIDRRFGFMFSRLYVEDSMSRILSRLLRIPVNGKPLTIVDISGVPSEVVDVVVSVLARMIFDFCLWAGEGRNHAAPVLLVCEEAHRYVPRDDALHFGPSKKAIARIAKEGRKYGVGLCLVSQRPSELSTLALSQCNTMIALRMSNVRDQEFVRNALPESASGLLTALPSLGQQEAIIAGDGVSIPMRMRFDDLTLEKRPASGTASFSRAWQDDGVDAGFVEQTVARWRLQKR